MHSQAFYDAVFRVSRKNGSWKEVPAPDPALEGPLADTHVHLSMVPACDVALARAAVRGVDFACNITDPTEDAYVSYAGLSGWRMAAGVWLNAMAPGADTAVPRLRLACGVHPHNAKRYSDAVEQFMLERLRDERTCCLGEVGLDYHYDLSPRDVQQRVFRRQVRLAHETGLPLALHVREAHTHALAILDEEGFPAAGTILHCCTIGPRELEPWLERGCFVAFGGAVTFPKLDEVRESARIVPENRLLTETDGPYMAPVPLRGQDCGPDFIVFTAEAIAAARGVEPGEGRRFLLERMHQNALGLLDRPATAWQAQGNA